MSILHSLLRPARALVLALSSVAALAGPTAPDLFARAPSDLRAEAVAAGAEGKSLAVFLTLPDCPGCLEMERKVHPALAQAFSARFRSVRVDLAQNGELIDPAGKTTTPSAFARRLRAVGTPAYAFFDGRGELLYRHTGTLDEAGFSRLADYVAKGEYEERPFAPRAHKGTALHLNATAPSATLAKSPDFSLAGSDGQSHRLSDFRGYAIALAVGYTRCPDVCPTTLAEMKAAVEALPAALRPKVQLLFATLDPERDGLPLLGQYAAAFQPKGGRPILGLRGSPAETAELVRQLQLVAEKQPSASMGYTLDHSAGVFLFDSRGRLLGISPYGQPLEQLSRDLAAIAADAARPARHLAQH